MGDDRSTEQRIVDSSYGVLVERGFEDFTTQAVADAAGVSQSLVHYYFDTKKDLVLAMFESGLEYVTDEVDEDIDGDDPRDRLVELAYTLVADDDEDAIAFQRMMLGLQSKAPYDDDLREIVSYNQSFFREYVGEAVLEGIENGQFREVNPDSFAAMYVAAIGGATDWKAIFGAGGDYDAALDGLETVVDDYLVAGTDPERPGERA